jgi:hypothetical protein
VAERLDSRLESEGAEFLVLGYLLLERIPSYKTYTQMPGYDLVATNPENGRAARIQVKSRWATDSNQAVLLRAWDFDFLVYVALNRGHRYRLVRSEETAVRSPEFFVFPRETARLGVDPTSSWGRISTKRIPQREDWRDNWGCIRSFLELTP